MERQGSRFLGIPFRTLAIVVGSAIAIGVASLIFFWPTVSALFPATVHKSPTPTGNATYEVVAESATTAYLLVRPPGAVLPTSLYRTRDSGATWQRMTLPASGDGFALRSLPGGNLFLRTFAIATGSQQFYVGDGSTWTDIAVPEQGAGSLRMVNARVGFYVNTESAGTPAVQELVIYRTLDGGHTWDQRLNLNAIHSKGGGLDLSDSHTLITFADSSHGWLVVIPRSWGIVCGVPDATNPAQQLLTSHDGGANWTPVPLPRLPQGSTALATPVFPGSGANGYLTITANSYLGPCPPAGITLAYGTLDDGTTWSGPQTLPGAFVGSPDGVVWWASDGLQLFLSTNQGQSWKTTKPHLPAAAITLEELVVVNAQTAWSLWSAGGNQVQPQKEELLRTTDAGTHWSVLLGTMGIAPHGEPGPDGSAIRRRRATAIAAVALVAVAAAGFVYLRSGATSRTGTSVTPTPPSGPNPVAYSFVTPTLGWAALNVTNPSSPPAQFDVFNTTDGAQHWRLQFMGHGSTPGLAQLTVHLFDSSNGFMALGLPSTGEQLYRTSDRGDTWTQVQLPSPPCVEVTFVDALQGWALVQDPAEPTSGQLFDLYATGDGGASWHRVPDPPRDAYYMAIRAPGEAWMGSLGAGPPHLYTSTDAGQSWQRHDLPPPSGRSWDSNGRGTTVDLLPEQGVVATTGFTTTSPNPSEPALFTSFDRGSSWRYLAPPPGFVAYQDASHWWAIKDTALFKSADAGQTWKRITNTLPSWQFVPHAIDAKHAWAELSMVGGFGLGLTDDGGLHWRPANVPSVA